MGIETSIAAVDRALTKMDITWKKILTIPVEWNTPEVIQARYQFVNDMAVKFMRRPKVFLDEAAFHMRTKKSKGRALAGEPALLTVLPRGKRISLLMTITENGVPHSKIINSLGVKKRGVNAEDFRSFILDLAGKVERDSVLILDNARIHHAQLMESTWTMLKSTFGIDVYYLPPYSPFLNPIELAFNDLKMAVKGTPFYNLGDLERVIKEKIPSLTGKTEAFWIHTTKFYPLVTLRLPFQGKPLDPHIIGHPTETTEPSHVETPFLALPAPEPRIE